MCPDIVETKLMYEREREWKPDPQVINKWTVLHNLQKDYLQRIKPSLDGMKNYQEVLTDKIKKEKQEKENLQNLIQFQNKVNADLRKGDEIKNNSFDSDDKKCDDEELKYKNNKIVGAAKNKFDKNNLHNYNNNNNNNGRSEIENLEERNNNNNGSNNSGNNLIANDSNNNSSDKPNLFALNKKIFNDFKSNASFNNAENYNDNNNSNSSLSSIAQSEKKLDNSNISKLKSAMASFFNKDDKAAFKFSETKSEIKSENANEDINSFIEKNSNKMKGNSLNLSKFLKSNYK